MRIIGGRLKGLALASVGKGDPGAHLRPTTDRVRESLFNLLTHGPYDDPFSGAVVLDLFAGTGALGLEALSRGAASVTFVESGRVGARLVGENVAKARASEQARLLRRDATKLGPCDGDAATLVFLDPPYGKGLGPPALAAADRGRWIAPGALIVWEDSAAPVPPDGFEALDQRRYGDTTIAILRKSAD